MNINPIVVDLSHFQNVRDWTAVHAAGIRGVINKATEGPGLVDRTFAIRRAPVAAAGLLYGGYHFLRPGDVTAQVKHFLDATAPHDGLLLALDHEDPRVPLSAAKAFLSQVKAAVGRYPILYSGFLIKQQLQQLHPNTVDPDLAKVKLWLAQYTANPSWPSTWKQPWIWQFTGDGNGPLPHTIGGIDGTGLDIDSYSGTAEQLATEWTV